MNTALRLCLVLALAGSAVGPRAQAAEPGLEVQMKIRAGVQATSRKDNLGVGMLGFGLEAAWSFDGVNGISLEPGFLYKAGTQYLDNVGAMAHGTGVNPVDPDASVDSRKNQVQGITFRLAYQRALAGCTLQGGLMLARLQFRQEYVGDVTALPVPDASHPGSYLDPSYHDTYNGVLEKRTFSVSPFVGVRIPTFVGQTLEVTILGLNYTAANYVHMAGSGGKSTASDRTETASRFVPHLELAYGFQF